MRTHQPILALACFALLCASPAAAMTSDEISCRATIAKSLSKYARSAAKAAATCHGQRSVGNRPITDDCNDVNVADESGLLERMRDDIRERIEDTCTNRAPALLSQYTTCPAPAATADNGGPTTGIDNFVEVADCLLELTSAHVRGLSLDAEGNPDDRLLDPLRKCQGKLGKNANRIFLTYVRERTRCQSDRDRDDGDATYSCDNTDPRGRIRKSRNKFNDQIESSCFFSSEVLADLNACSDELYALIGCAGSSAAAHGDALARGIYELSGSSATTTTTLPDPGDACADTYPDCNGSCETGSVCSTSGAACICVPEATGPCRPATIIRTIHGKYGSIPSETSLSTGWSGATHDVEIPDMTGDVVDVTCDEHCENCSIDLNVQENNPASNCRCTSNPQTTCTAINGTDADSCGSLDPTCRCYFGSPLAISSGGTPVCVVNRIREDYDGKMNLRSGEWFDQIRLAAVVYLGLDTSQPCPICDGDLVANDGVRDGTCAGGVSSGSCDVNGTHATFGPTSWDCLPASAANISGSGLLIDLRSSGTEQSLAATLPCDTPFGEDCHCRVCSGNGNLGCSSDAQCAAASAGVCTNGGGAGVVLNQCDGFQCGSDGECVTGPIDSYCDGSVHPDGRGYLPCSSDTDCSGAGSCTVIDKRRCFPDPIVRTGNPDRYEPYSSSIFCIAPTSNAAVNLAAGLPGPGALTLRFTSDIRCKSDPDLDYEFPGGANCDPVSGTTTTTLLPLPPCDESESPVCGGVCPTGSVCGDSGGACTCTGVPLPACEDAAAPVCGGVCASVDDLCQQDGEGGCACAPAALPQCLDATAPVCGGLCPTGEVCTDVGGTCDCGAPGLPSCSAALAPACGGVCDVGSACVANAGATACECVSLGLPTCGAALPPTCAGTCSVGSLCQDVLGACQCVTVPLP